MSAESSRWRLAGIVAVAACALTGTLLSPPAQPAKAKEPELDALANEYVKETRPLVQRYCQRCHGAKRTEADINLEAIATWGDVRKNVKTWQKAAEMLDTRQMPPKQAKQPTDAERSQLQK